ncbi:hypothetical protein QUC31_009381 [Theobroma cacao]
MEEYFRRPSYRPAAAGVGGRNPEISDSNMLKYVNKVYFGRSSLPPALDPSPFDRKQNAKKKRKEESRTTSKSWWNEPKMKRKRRLAKYKMFALEGKLKESLKKGSRWIKKKYCKIVHGY